MDGHPLSREGEAAPVLPPLREEPVEGPAIPAPPAEAPRSSWRAVLALAWPVLAQQFLILLVSLSDSFLAGYFEPMPPEQRAEAAGHRLLALGLLGAPSAAGMGPALAAETPWAAANFLDARHVSYQSAQTTAHYLAWLISCYTVFVSVGSTALVARFIGAGDRRAAIHVTGQSVLLGVVLGLLGSAAGLAGREALVSLLQLRGETVLLASDYLRPLFLLLVFQVVESAGIACLVGAGDTRTGLMVLGGVTLVNLPLAWLFFHGAGPFRGLGFEGIALGTAVSHVLGGLAVLVILARGRAGLRLVPRQLLPDAGLLWRLLRISVPAGLNSLSAVVGQLWFLGIVNGLGDVAGSAHGIAIRWEALGYLSGGAFGTAAMALVGQNLGARQPAQAARSGWLAFGMGCGVMCAMGAVFFALARPMFLLFCPHPEQRAVVEAGVPVLRLVAFAMPFLACSIIFNNALQGAGDTRVPVLFTWVGFLGVRIPLAYALTGGRLDLGLFGAWVAMFADLVVRGGFFLYRFAGGRWQTIRV